MSWHVPEAFRIEGPECEPYGAFKVPVARDRKGVPTLYAYTRATCHDGWEHVSVTLCLHTAFMRCPSWQDMCAVKHLFWDDSDLVVQFHVDDGNKVNINEFCLHLWRPTDAALPRPSASMVE